MRLFKKRSGDELMILALRFAGGSVFLWFGIDKWIRPEVWFGWMPAWFWPLSPVSAGTTIVILGVIEFIVGLLLVTGRYVRFAAAVAILQIAVILAATGISEVAVRDAGLMGIYVALLVDADRRATTHIPRNVLSWIGILFIVSLFFIGILFLKTS